VHSGKTSVYAEAAVLAAPEEMQSSMLLFPDLF